MAGVIGVCPPAALDHGTAKSEGKRFWCQGRRLIGDADKPLLVRASNGAEAVRLVVAQHDFFTGHVSLDRSAVHLMLAIAVRTVDSPHRPIALRRDRAPHQVLPHPRCRDRLAPLAIAVRFDEQLIAELRRVVRLAILRLLLEVRRLDTAALVLPPVADVPAPQRATPPPTPPGETVPRPPPPAPPPPV